MSCFFRRLSQAIAIFLREVNKDRSENGLSPVGTSTALLFLAARKFDTERAVNLYRQYQVSLKKKLRRDIILCSLTKWVFPPWNLKTRIVASMQGLCCLLQRVFDNRRKSRPIDLFSSVVSVAFSFNLLSTAIYVTANFNHKFRLNSPVEVMEKRTKLILIIFPGYDL